MEIYGADYYPEHWSKDKWKEHVDYIRQYGIEWVRIGEFDWALVEPEDGIFDFTLLDEAVEFLKSNGIKVIMGTPSATPPAWLIKKHPEILPVDWKGNVRGFGSRRHYSLNSKVFREYAFRITEMYAKHFNDRIDCWQTDNEFGCHDTTYSFTKDDLLAFRKWLKKKYGSIDKLNEKWGTVFWSQKYNDWDEIVFPINTPTFENPHQMLDIYRFMSDSTIEFHNKLVSIIKKYSSKPITHNFMVDFFDIDYKKFSDYVDFVSWDNYIPTKVYDPLRQSANHTLMRSLKKAPFLVIEQQPGRVNWRITNEYYDGDYVGMWVKQSYIDGALGNMIFRMEQIRFGAEQYHGGLLDYAGRPTKALEVYKETKDETPGTIKPKKEIAIFYSYENDWIHRINHINRNFKYWDGIVDYYKTFKMLGYNVDFVFEDDDLEDYKVLVVPYAKFIPEKFIEKIKNFEGIKLMTCMSGLKDEYNWLNERFPAGLIEEFGIEVREFGSIDEEDINLLNNTAKSKYWIDIIDIKDAKVLGTTLDGSPLITQKTNNYYIGTVLAFDNLKNFISTILPPKIIGQDFESVETQDGTTVILNLRKDSNVVWKNSRQIVLEKFEIKALG